jgi:hypothetical protein
VDVGVTVGDEALHAVKIQTVRLTPHSRLHG